MCSGSDADNCQLEKYFGMKIELKSHRENFRSFVCPLKKYACKAMKCLVLVNFKAVPKASFHFHIIAYLYPHKNEIRQEMGERIGQFYVLSRCSFWVWCPRLLECSQKEAMSCSHALHAHSVSKLYSLAFKFNFWFNLITFSILKLTH